ncbi:MAG: NAD(P)/FAD-dependent oxidoreductase [Bacteroidetes bacterium]|nr:NAD(P)/FAD-dependent oxidoreductase [Bacteroidota bacterium]
MTYRYDDTSLPKIVIIGGGFAGLELVKRLNNKPYRVTLLDKNNFHTFQPLLYQIASAGLTAESIAYPFRRKIGQYPNIIFRMATVEKIDPQTQKVITDVGDFEYDHLIIASGAVTNFYGNTAIEKVSFTLKSVQEALDMRSAILHKFERAIISDSTAEQKQRMNFIIVGGGPTGVELAGALAEIRKNVLPHDYRELKGENMEIHLIEGSGRLLAAMSEKASRLAKKYLESDGVKVWLNALVQNFDGDELLLSNGEKIKTDNIIWAAGVKGATIDGISAESIVRGGKYQTDAFNRIKNYSNIYAIGDIAFMTEDKNFPNGHPGVAQVAIQQASNLANNFIRLNRKKELKPFKYKNKGNMATIGRHKAVVDLPFYSFGGYLAWYIWMFIHLMALVGFRNRFMVFMNWMWNYFSYDRALRIIVEPEEKNT